jgi:hypothetical protein
MTTVTDAAADETRARGLLGSLEDLSFRAALFALGLALGVTVLRFASGYRVGDSGGGDVPAPILAVAIASFVLVPMLALASAASAVIVMAGAALQTHPAFARVWRAAFLVVVAAWAMVAAYVYDVLVIPAIT